MSIRQFTDSLPMRLYAALDVVMPRFRRIFRDHGITEQQWRVLRVLWDLESVSQAELAGFCHIPAPSLVGVLDRLERLGLIARRRAASDRRIMQVVATPAGHALREKLLPAVQQAYFDLRAGIDDDTWRQLLQGLDALARLNR